LRGIPASVKACSNNCRRRRILRGCGLLEVGRRLILLAFLSTRGLRTVAAFLAEMEPAPLHNCR